MAAILHGFSDSRFSKCDNKRHERNAVSTLLLRGRSGVASAATADLFTFSLLQAPILRWWWWWQCHAANHANTMPFFHTCSRRMWVNVKCSLMFTSSLNLVFHHHGGKCNFTNACLKLDIGGGGARWPGNSGFSE